MALRKVEKKTTKEEVLKIYKDIKDLLAFEKYETADVYLNPCPSTEFLCDLKYDCSFILIVYKHFNRHTVNLHYAGGLKKILLGF